MLLSIFILILFHFQKDGSKPAVSSEQSTMLEEASIFYLVDRNYTVSQFLHRLLWLVQYVGRNTCELPGDLASLGHYLLIRRVRLKWPRTTMQSTAITTSVFKSLQECSKIPAEICSESLCDSGGMKYVTFQSECSGLFLFSVYPIFCLLILSYCFCWSFSPIMAMIPFVLQHQPCRNNDLYCNLT